ncbi:MAG: putative phosphothreonine lyase domain-containing protein [Acidobacteriaceae bacterium]
MKPSEVTDTFWIEATRKQGSYPAPSENSGKWLIFVSHEHVDEVWEKVRVATEQGSLGDSAKVSTAHRNRNAANPNTNVICVYTYDWTDAQDVRRIREALRQLGILSKIPYKANRDTASGLYANRGNRNIAKYFE